MVIPARGRNFRVNATEEIPKLRVAAYCRVSTEDEEQASSYKVQKEFYFNYINSKPEWTLAGIFADEGISGTSTKNRTEFNRMIEECMAGNIDMVITKSISRFARNTLDCLKYIRQLKDKNIPVFFEKENILTTDTKGEIMLTIMASLAQQESQSLSQNVKLGIQFRYQQGEIQINHNRFLGYTKDENKKLVIVPKEAEIVKRIYREYLEGSSLQQISRSLEADEITTGSGGKRWHTSTINKILRNEKYIGDALLQKTYTVDFLSKKRVFNNGIMPQYYVENSHKAIIPREIFMQVQEELARRRCVHTTQNGKKRNYSNNHTLAQIVFCGYCGEIFRRVNWYSKGNKHVVWRCTSRLENTGSYCSASTIIEDDLKTCIMKVINQTLCGKNDFIHILKENIATVLNKKNDQSLDEIDTKLEELQNELLRLANSKAGYENVAEEIHKLREIKQKCMVQNAEREGQKQRIDEMTEFMQEQSGVILEYDEHLVRGLIEKVIVFDDTVNVKFKFWLEIEVKI